MRFNHFFIFFVSLCISLVSFAEEKQVIEGKRDPGITEIIEGKTKELQKSNEELRGDIVALQDSLISKNKDYNSLKISIKQKNEEGLPAYGVIQLLGWMNTVSLLRYDKPLLINKEEMFPLFDGVLPLGKYEFKLKVVVGQQLEKWPFVLPEGRWNLEKNVDLELLRAGEKKNVTFLLQADQLTGVPELKLQQDKEE